VETFQLPRLYDRIIESFRLEKTHRIIESNRKPNTAKSTTEPRHQGFCYRLDLGSACDTVRLMAGQLAEEGLPSVTAGNVTAGPCLHPADKGSSSTTAVLQLLLVRRFGQHFPKFKWRGRGKGVRPGKGAATRLPHGQLAGGDGVKGKPGALRRKSSETARVGLAPSHRINSTLSMPELFYAPLCLTDHNRAKL